MPFCHLPALLTSCFARLGTALDPRSALRLPVLLCGLLFASGRRTCTSWFRAAGSGADFWSCGRRAEGGWRAYFCTKAEATPAEILEAVADRGALEETNKDVKEVWGAGQQQVRNLDANVGCFNLNGWMYSLVEAWAWDKPDAELVDRSDSPWDEAERRPSHADKRKALQREVLRQEIEEVLAGPLEREKIRELAEKLLRLAA